MYFTGLTRIFYLWYTWQPYTIHDTDFDLFNVYPYLFFQFVLLYVHKSEIYFISYGRISLLFLYRLKLYINRGEYSLSVLTMYPIVCILRQTYKYCIGIRSG